MFDANDLLDLQEEAERDMLDLFAVYVPDLTPTRAADGMESLSYTRGVDTAGKVRAESVRSFSTASRSVRVAGEERRVLEGGVHIPVSAAAPVGGGLGIGWEYELVEPGPMTPEDLIGSRWLVLAAPVVSAMTARRLNVVRLR